MTHRRTWQKAEADVARLFGGQRAHGSGSNQSGTTGDAVGSPYYIEVKYRRHVPFVKLWEMVQAEAAKEGKPAILVMVQARQLQQRERASFAVVDVEWLAERLQARRALQVRGTI